MLSLYNDLPVFDIFDAFRYLDSDRSLIRRRSTESVDDNGLKIEMPGVKVSDLEVNVENRILKISGKSRHGKEFSYSYSLRSSVDESKITATLQDGLLEISLPKRQESSSRKIQISI